MPPGCSSPLREEPPERIRCAEAPSLAAIRPSSIATPRVSRGALALRCRSRAPGPAACPAAGPAPRAPPVARPRLAGRPGPAARPAAAPAARLPPRAQVRGAPLGEASPGSAYPRSPTLDTALCESPTLSCPCQVTRPSRCSPTSQLHRLPASLHATPAGAAWCRARAASMVPRRRSCEVSFDVV